MPGLRGEPFAKLGSSVLGHCNRRVFRIVTGEVAHVVVHRHVRWRRLGDGIDQVGVTLQRRFGREVVGVEIE